MGMTIDKSIENIVLLKKLEDSLGNISGNTNSVTSQSLGCAIETMRKYQKIVGIVSLNDEEFKQCGLKELKEILEVIAGWNNSI